MEPIFEIKEEKVNERHTRFIISPLVAGFGNTLGTVLRRVLLTGLKGAAITRVKISGAKHQFSTLKGVKEDMLDFLLNLKKVRFTYSGDKPAKVKLSTTGVGEVKAGNIEVPTGVTVANPELVLATLAKGGKLEAEMEVESKIGYSPAGDRSDHAIGVIPLDAVFSPIVRVNYSVEETRVGRVTNYDKLLLDIWTDGTVEPKQALDEASNILISYFDQIVNPKEIKKKEKEESGAVSLGSVGQLSVEEIGLPTRVANALSRAGYDTVEKLARADRVELMKVRNLGEKSIKIIDVALGEKGVKMGNA